MNIKLYNEDSLAAMRQMPDKCYDLAIVDPPYGIGRDGHNGAQSSGWVKHAWKKWDNLTPKKEYFDELFRVSKNQIIWGGNYMVEFLPPSMGWIVWFKGQEGLTMSDCELAFSSFDRATRQKTIFRLELVKDGIFHPTQKPVKLYKWLLKNYAKEGDKILDTHGGSGSILIACYDMGFSIDWYEIDKDYFDAAKKRFENHKKQLQLFRA